jgi:hypothetical protein
MPSETQGHVEVRLTPDEALVLFELLFRYSDSDELRIADQSEQRALWNLCCLLEKQLVEPFKANYVELLEAARNRLRDNEDTNSEPGAFQLLVGAMNSQYHTEREYHDWLPRALIRTAPTNR